MRRADAINEIREKVNLIETILIVRDPGATMAADAYEGLRKQVVATSGERRAHLSHIAAFDSAIRRGESLEELALLMSDLMQQVGVEAVLDYDPKLFEAQGEGSAAEVLEPAYVDAGTRAPVRQGRARLTTPPAPEAPSEATGGEG